MSKNNTATSNIAAYFDKYMAPVVTAGTGESRKVLDAAAEFAGLEGFSAVAVSAKSSIEAAVTQFANNNSNTYNVRVQTPAGLRTESRIVEYTQAQRDSMQYGLEAQVDVMSTIRGISNNKEITLLGGTENINYALENFDPSGANVAALTKTSFMLNLRSQDNTAEFDRAVYPTIAIPVTSPAVTYELNYTAILPSDLKHSIDGKNMPDLISCSIIPKLYTEGLFSDEPTLIVPNYISGQNEASFLTACSYVKTANGTSTTTAPLLVDDTASLIGLSTSDVELARGAPGTERTIAQTVAMGRVFFSISGTINNVSTTEYFVDDVRDRRSSEFSVVGDQSTDSKNMVLNGFRAQPFTFNTSNATVFSGQSSALLAELPQNHTVTITYGLSGEINTANGNKTISKFGPISIVSVRNGSGDEISTTGADYSAIRALVNTIEVRGYELQANFSNTDLSMTGQLLRSTTISAKYPAAPITLPMYQGSIVPLGGTEGDDIDGASRLFAAKRHTEAVKHLMTTITRMRNAKEDGQEVLNAIYNQPSMPNTTAYTPYFNTSDIDLMADVNSLQSSDRLVNARSALVNAIRAAVTDMVYTSGVLKAHEQIKGQEAKIDITIVTHTTIVTYLQLGGNAIDITEKYNVKLVSTQFETMADKVIIVLGDPEVESTATPSIISWGFCAETPLILVPIQNRGNMTAGKAVIQTTQPIQRRSFHLTAPVAFLLNVVNAADVFKHALPIYTKAV